MKKINLTLTLLTCLIIFNKGLKAQGHNLEFEQAVFNTYNAVGDGNSTSDVILTQTLIVPANKILKIESVSCFGFGANGGIAAYASAFLTINGAIPGGSATLPAGTYTIKIIDSATNPSLPATASVVGYISGVLYNIVP